MKVESRQGSEVAPAGRRQATELDMASPGHISFQIRAQCLFAHSLKSALVGFFTPQTRQTPQSGRLPGILESQCTSTPLAGPHFPNEKPRQREEGHLIFSFL